MRNNRSTDSILVFFRNRIPLILTIFLMLFFYVPVRSIELIYLRPAIGMICVFYWVLKKYSIFGYVSAFIVGLLMDIYSSTPLGLNVLMMMILVSFTSVLPRYFKGISFGTTWGIFAVISLCITLLKWLIFSIYFKQFIPIAEIMFSLLSTVMFYPLIAAVNSVVLNNFLPQERINE